MNPPFLYFFIAVTAAAVVFTGYLQSLVLKKFFRGFVEETKRIEAELNEYYALSILAIAMNDREAYEGFQRMANEKYWPLFFRKMMFSTSLFFLLLTPYMILTTVFVDPDAFMYTMVTAISYFTARLGLGFILDSFNAWKKAREARRNFDKC